MSSSSSRPRMNASMGFCTHAARRTAGTAAAMLIGTIGGAIVGNNVGSGNAATGALIGGALGGAAGAIRGSNQDRANQQRYRDNQGRYYYCYDNRQDECYWDNGQRRY